MLSTTAVQSLIAEHYDIQAEIKPLNGYEDWNYLLKSTDNQRFICKITPLVHQAPVIIDQHNSLAALAKKGNLSAAYPSVIADKYHENLVQVEINGKFHLLRVLTFLEGEFLANISPSQEFLTDFGRFLGRIDLTLKDTPAPAIQQRRLIWDPQYFMDLERYLDSILDAHRQAWVRYFLLQFETEIKPIEKDLPKSLIHGDANDWNVLANEQRVTGIIDFGDMMFTYRISEIAIALTYVMMDVENPLEMACAMVAGYQEEYPLTRIELKALYYLIAARVCTSVTMAAHSRKENPENEYISIHEAAGWRLIETMIQLNPIKMESALLAAAGFSPEKPPEISSLLENRFRHISKSQSLAYETPIHMKKAAFQYMYDDSGATYLDGVNNICHVGHCHPHVVKAAQKQMALLNTNTRYLYESLNEYAEKLLAYFPEALNKVFFVNSGSAATDLAVRLAKTHTQRNDLVIVDHAYHGNTEVGIELSPYKFNGEGGKGQMKNIHKAMIPDTFRGIYKSDDPDAGNKYAEHVKELLDAAEANDTPIAAFFCESILGCGGQIVLPEGYLEAVYAHVRKSGGVCVADEVQVGFGRVGDGFWGFELQKVVPDVVVIGKPIGNGHPMAAVITTEAIAQSFENGMEFFSSFGGNPVSCEIGKAVLEVIEKEQLQSHAKEVGDYLLSAFKEIQASFTAVGDVRGKGLFLGIELIKDSETLAPAAELASHMVARMKSEGILLSTDGPYHNVIKIKPPLSFSMNDANKLIRVFRKIMESC